MSIIATINGLSSSQWWIWKSGRIDIHSNGDIVFNLFIKRSGAISDRLGAFWINDSNGNFMHALGAPGNGPEASGDSMHLTWAIRDPLVIGLFADRPMVLVDGTGGATHDMPFILKASLLPLATIFPDQRPEVFISTDATIIPFDDGGPGIYEIHISTFGLTPIFPVWLVDKMRSLLATTGWLLNNVFPDGNGYTFLLERQGSIALLALIAAIKPLLWLIGIVVTGWTVVNLSKNVVEFQGNTLVEDDLEQVIGMVNTGTITASEGAELITALNGLKTPSSGSIIPSGSITLPNPGDILGGLTSGTNMLLIGGIAVFALLAFNKR